ncbi:MAG: HNH endonuclease [Candidatus Krumholzibacteriia bacterium]
MRAAVEAGELGYTKARELVSVASPATEERWLAEALGNSRRELEEKTARVHRKARARLAAAAPRVRRAVLARDSHQCRAPGCHHRQFLEVHHVVPRARGGGNSADNLITLCSGCHRLWHERGSAAAYRAQSRCRPACT